MLTLGRDIMEQFRVTLAAGVLVLALLLPGASTQDQKNLELNTVLMESTFKVEGRNAQRQFHPAFLQKEVLRW
jgi:hypothetical protein